MRSGSKTSSATSSSAARVSTSGLSRLRPRFAVRVASLALLSLAISMVAGCASAPPAEETVWLDEDAFRSCLGLRIPVELLRDPSRVKGAVLLEIDVLPSGRIERASILSGSGNPALDQYLAGRLGSLNCAPFEKIDTDEPYSVELELNLDVAQ